MENEEYSKHEEEEEDEKIHPEGVASSSLLKDISHFYREVEHDIYKFFYPYDEDESEYDDETNHEEYHS